MKLLLVLKLFDPSIEFQHLSQPVVVEPWFGPIVPEPGKLWWGEHGGNIELVDLVHSMITVLGQEIIPKNQGCFPIQLQHCLP